MIAAVRDHIQNLTQTRPKKSEYIQRLKAANVKDFASKLEADDNRDELFSEIWL